MAEPLKLEWRKDQMPAELVELRSHLDKLPLVVREQLIPLCDRVGHYTRLQGKLVRIAQDAVDQLHLDIKYLLFDLEIFSDQAFLFLETQRPNFRIDHDEI